MAPPPATVALPIPMSERSQSRAEREPEPPAMRKGAPPWQDLLFERMTMLFALVVLFTLVGIIGALIGGYLFNEVGHAGITGFNLYSMFVAVIGSVIVLLIYHAIRRT